MKNNFKLDISTINKNFFDNVHLIGIATDLENFQLCLLLNKNFKYRFRLNLKNQLQLFKEKREKPYLFNVYESLHPNEFVNYYLYENINEYAQLLLPDYKQIDFILMINGSQIDKKMIEQTIQKIKSLETVTLAFEIMVERIKKPEDLIFDKIDD